MKARGFTIIELLFITVVLIAVGALFWTQKNNIEVAARDDKRKIAINSMYYSLEEIFHKQSGYYPMELTPETLPSVDKKLFTDPRGIQLGKGGSDYRYEPSNCTDDKCQSYTLRANLENEADYVKTNR
ncbi:MAG TPA: type II secretion system protein [Candidatus Saccharibacteria bacterium]|nr:type II secretion system protein [Candidatus Saccharibacteria bacterium]